MKKIILLSLIIVGCEEPSQNGCLDSQACNYDAGNKNGLAKNNSSVSYLGNKNIKAIVEERKKVK